MKHTPKTIKRTLRRCIKGLSSHPELYCKNPGKDFTRERKLSFEQVLKAVISMTGKSLRSELMEYFNLNTFMPTISAFVQQRNKVSHYAFEALFHTFTKAVDEQALIKGYRLLAVDGSELHTPTNKDATEAYYKGTNGQKPYKLFHLNALYDLQRKIYTDAVVYESRCGSEHKSFVTMVDRDDSPIPTIYIADRGYESYNNIAHVVEKGQKFVIRVKDRNGNGILTGLNLPDDEFDLTFTLRLTRKQTNEVKRSDLKYLAHSIRFDFLPATSRKYIPMQPYYLSFRVVRFKLTDDTHEVLLTNLTEGEFSISELKELYAMRGALRPLSEI